MKDNFSKQASDYSKYRPGYPEEYINGFIDLAEKKTCAWDCATGNGQVAVQLARSFEQVIATDISEKQLSHAPEADNIDYRLEPAEATSISTNSIDLITVGQAIHLFNFDEFYAEANRVLKKNGVISIFGYLMLETNSPLDEPIQYFYHEITGPYWDPERRYIDEEYTSVPFPFEMIHVPVSTINSEWTFDEMIGYFRTWSAVQHCIAKTGEDPVEWLRPRLKDLWPDQQKIVVSMKLINKTGRKLT